ncbi:hypothetical protein [Staphylococcus phage vB_SauH_DELF3]|nr:hypothetical protein [Staphylococcus phage vB_SauH_DELF3]
MYHNDRPEPTKELNYTVTTANKTTTKPNKKILMKKEIKARIPWVPFNVLRSLGRLGTDDELCDLIKEYGDTPVKELSISNIAILKPRDLIILTYGPELVRGFC